MRRQTCWLTICYWEEDKQELSVPGRLAAVQKRIEADEDCDYGRTAQLMQQGYSESMLQRS